MQEWKGVRLRSGRRSFIYSVMLLDMESDPQFESSLFPAGELIVVLSGKRGPVYFPSPEFPEREPLPPLDNALPFPIGSRCTSHLSQPFPPRLRKKFPPCASYVSSLPPPSAQPIGTRKSFSSFVLSRLSRFHADVKRADFSATFFFLGETLPRTPCIPPSLPLGVFGARL